VDLKKLQVERRRLHDELHNLEASPRKGKVVPVL
jgi:hypothetical protein